MIIAYGLSIIVLSCNKDNNTESWSFTWTHQNVSHTAVAADAYLSASGPIIGPNEIVATDRSIPTNNYRIDIKLSSLAPNTYSVGTVSNTFDYIDDLGFNLTSVQGTVTISLNSNSKLSGSFSVNLNNTTTITGAFNKINLHP